MSVSVTRQARPGAELQLIASYRTALRRFLRKTEAAAAEAGLTAERYDLLLMIEAATEAGRTITVNDLRERLQLRQQAVTELVKRAVAAGLVERERSSQDGRVFHLRLTAEGAERMRRVFRALQDDRNAVFATFHDLDAHFRASMPERMPVAALSFELRPEAGTVAPEA